LVHVDCVSTAEILLSFLSAEAPVILMALKVPDPPYIAAGAMGGPAVIYAVTPLRNALTLGALDQSKSALRLYQDVFSKGFLDGFAGGQYMAKAAVPGFLVIGPLFHVYKDLAGGSSAAAVALTSLSETAIFIGSETRNAQIAFNGEAEKRGTTKITRLQSPYNPIGPGVGLHIARNYLAMSGLRIFSKPCQDVLEKARPEISPGTRAILGDFIANIVVSAVSAPLHQLYGFSVTQRLIIADGVAKESAMEASIKFLRKQYLTSTGRVSSIAGRDVLLRVAYNATIFTLYGFIERGFVSNWPNALQW